MTVDEEEVLECPWHGYWLGGGKRCPSCPKPEEKEKK